MGRSRRQPLVRSYHEAVLDGTAQVIGYLTVVEAHLLAGLTHHGLGDQRAANQATERTPRCGC